jgi:hypothetical protein
MHEPKPPRTLEQIDRDLNVERGILAHEARAGRRSSGCVTTWRHIDDLLDERLTTMRLLPVVPEMPHPAPAPLNGGVVPG